MLKHKKFLYTNQSSVIFTMVNIAIISNMFNGQAECMQEIIKNIEIWSMWSIFKDRSKGELLVNTKRIYASVSGKSRLDDRNIFDKKTAKELINNHAQLCTDFNIIYSNLDDIRVYSLGTLITKPVLGKSFTISKSKNYLQEKKTQEIIFFKKPLLVKNNLHVIKKSKEYFENNTIRDVLESTKDYKMLFDQVIEELNSKNIKYKLAVTEEEKTLTGLNILLKSFDFQEKDNYMQTLLIKKNDEVD